jgi:hypothetical protein
MRIRRMITRSRTRNMMRGRTMGMKNRLMMRIE